jgi:AcrR family transcriptional regulator
LFEVVHDGHVQTERRTQSERTDATMGRLVEATVSALTELGYRGATTTEIAERAGVSRGAMLHHFPNRALMFAATADWITDVHVERFEHALSAVGDRADRLAVAIDELWAICSSPMHVGWLEFAAAAHHEPELATTITLASARMRERTRATWAAMFPDLQSYEFGATAPDFALSLLEGLALSQRSAPDPAVALAVVDGLKALSVLLTIPQSESEHS